MGATSGLAFVAAIHAAAPLVPVGSPWSHRAHAISRAESVRAEQKGVSSLPRHVPSVGCCVSIFSPRWFVNRHVQATKADVDNEQEYKQRDEEDVRQVAAGTITADKLAENRGTCQATFVHTRKRNQPRHPHPRSPTHHSHPR